MVSQVSSTKQNDKEYLKNLSREIFKSIDDLDIRQPFVVAKTGEIRDLNSGGWAVKLGIFRGYQCLVELWFDRFTAHGPRKLFYCIYSAHPRSLRKLAKLSQSFLGDHISISTSDWSNDERLIQLNEPLQNKDFGSPVLESYPEYKEYIYGIYIFERIRLQTKESKELVSRIVEFIVNVNSALSKKGSEQDAQASEANENKKTVQTHIRRERASRLAKVRKQYDHFVCQICGFDFTKAYGKLGHCFAEAHHIVPLSKNDKQRISTIKDLLTVCSNCHRMLHKMKGEAGDIAKLKKIVKQRVR